MGQNKRLAKQCAYTEIQPAVFDSGNNDRVVIMPGRYTEPTSRQQPLNDPKCAELTQQDSSGAETPSYRYQVTCPNDQNLVYVQGREVPDAPPPEPPLDNRQGIPDEGPCVRCNLQIEGSGPNPVDVIIDGGKRLRSKSPEAKPSALAKDVVLRVDRADGIVDPQPARPRRARARDLHRGDRRLPDRAHEDVLGRRLRQPHLHLRPRPVQELRRLRLRRRRRSTRAPRRRPASRRTSPSIPTRRGSTPWSRSATCAAASSATPARWATRCGSPRTRSTATAPGSRPTRSQPPGTRASRPTASRSTTTTSTPTTSTSTSENPPVEPVVGILPLGRRDLLGRPQQRQRPRQLHLRQLALGHVPGRGPGRARRRPRAT